MCLVGQQGLAWLQRARAHFLGPPQLERAPQPGSRTLSVGCEDRASVEDLLAVWPIHLRSRSSQIRVPLEAT